ncbi:MAG: hypothetical protein AAGB04_00730 [Pseudomonadota bacterium]
MHEETQLIQSLQTVFEIIGQHLAEVSPTNTTSGFSTSKYFLEAKPLLRVVTGLCEGGDEAAAIALDEAYPSLQKSNTDAGVRENAVETELAAIIPFPPNDYRASRFEEFRPQFDRRLEQCAWVLQADGIYTLGDKPLSKRRRKRGYQLQGQLLIRNCDLLIAAPNLTSDGKSGGTLETINEAMRLNLPVLIVDPDCGDVRAVNPGDNLDDILYNSPLTTDELVSQLSQWILRLVKCIDLESRPLNSTRPSYGETLLDDYFSRTDLKSKRNNRKRSRSFRERAWDCWQRRFRGENTSKKAAALLPYETYRERATELTYLYGGIYRGTVLVNYLLAIIAVVLAVTSLAILGAANHTTTGQEVAIIVGQIDANRSDSERTYSTSADAQEDANKETKADKLHADAEPYDWVLATVLVLAVLKLLAVGIIAWNTKQANEEQWNDRAVDYRYLAERLRSMYHLPLAGSHQPPAIAPSQLASRGARQSAIDWLFEAIIRSHSPADLQSPHSDDKGITTVSATTTIPNYDGSGNIVLNRFQKLDPLAEALRIRNTWVLNQAHYHDSNAKTMHRMNHFLETGAKRLSMAVFLIVLIDIFLVALKGLHFLPDFMLGPAKYLTYFLIATSAILPMVVAAMNGIRSQSECERLATRSTAMRSILAGPKWNAPSLFNGAEVHDSQITGGRLLEIDDVMSMIQKAQSDRATDIGSWSYDVLRIAEQTADDFVKEAVEWSVLYAKELSEV